ncbi:MAG: hypothetical protein HKN17_00050 [Rhodothermales bacterium]|nr:hypothetical protein [Rhodothermales bacterium]
MSSDVDRFLNESSAWRDEMTLLRRIALESGLDEDIKWGLPCFMHDGANVAIIQPFKETCAFMFFKGVLLDDPEDLLHAPGAHSHVARRIDFTNEGQIAAMEGALRGFIAQAVEAEIRGLDVPPRDHRESVPQELEDAFENVPGLEAAFFDLTPGRQRGYIIHFAGAKQASTRRSRIEKLIPKILEGRGLRD